ncbi:hypothetical protein ACF0H5_013392 [Mactra antiquata]
MEQSSVEKLSDIVNNVRKSRGRKRKSQNSKSVSDIRDLDDSNQPKRRLRSSTSSCAEINRKSLKETSSDSLNSDEGISMNSPNTSSCDTDLTSSKQTAKKRGRKRKQTKVEDCRNNKNYNDKTCDIPDSKSSPLLTFSKDNSVKLSDNISSVCTSTPITRKFGENIIKATPRARFSSLKFSFSDDDADNTINAESDLVNPTSDLSLPFITPVTTPSLPSIDESNLDSTVKMTLDSKVLIPSDASCDKCIFGDRETSCETDGADHSDDDDDDDDDLPVFNISKLDRSFRKNDIVWVKWKHWPYFPALVKTVYKKKKRLSVKMFGQPENLTISYTKKDNVLFLWDSKRAEILENTSKLSREDRQKFYKSLSAAENFVLPVSEHSTLLESSATLHAEDKNVTEGDNSPLTDTDGNKAETKQNHVDTKSSSSSEDLNTSVNNDTEVINNKDESVEKCDKKKEMNYKNKRDKTSVRPTNKELNMNRGKSASEQWEEKAIARKKKRFEWCKPLISFIKSTTMKKYLMDIYKGRIPSDLHKRYNSRSKKEKRESKLRTYGPINDEEQIDSIFYCFVEWLKEIDPQHSENMTNYMFDVWYPEAVVYAMKKKKKYTIKKAWEVFERGVKLTKAELNYLHPDIKLKKSRKNKKLIEIDELFQRIDSTS